MCSLAHEPKLLLAYRWRSGLDRVSECVDLTASSVLPIFDDFQATVAASVVASFPVDYTAVVIVAIGNLGDAIVQHPELQ
jgi:hypothetical protein